MFAERLFSSCCIISNSISANSGSIVLYCTVISARSSYPSNQFLWVSEASCFTARLGYSVVVFYLCLCVDEIQKRQLVNCVGRSEQTGRRKAERQNVPSLLAGTVLNCKQPHRNDRWGTEVGSFFYNYWHAEEKKLCLESILWFSSVAS